tara:strand:- start:1010 stop:1255 length:246 start_codon:yes stop_codon:yes gene_type:complete
MSEFYFFSSPLHNSIRINDIEKVKYYLVKINYKNLDSLSVLDEDNMTPLKLAEYMELNDIIYLIKDKIQSNEINMNVKPNL